MLLGWWLFVFGIWPFNDPGHDLFGGPFVVADLLLHAVGAAILYPALRASLRGRRS